KMQMQRESSWQGSNRRLEFQLGAWFEGCCGLALVLALSQMMEHGLGPFGRADLDPRRKPRSPKSKVQSPRSKVGVGPELENPRVKALGSFNRHCSALWHSPRRMPDAGVAQLLRHASQAGSDWQSAHACGSNMDGTVQLRDTTDCKPLADLIARAGRNGENETELIRNVGHVVHSGCQSWLTTPNGRHAWVGRQLGELPDITFRTQPAV